MFSGVKWFSVVKWACEEVERQQGSPMDVSMLCDAWGMTVHMADDHFFPDYHDAMVIAFLICPEKNVFSADQENLRRTPVHFANGNVCNAPKFESFVKLFEVGENALGIDTKSRADYADDFVYSLLDMHPWLDGNGRVASLIWNWLKGTLRDPQLLPDFDFRSNVPKAVDIV